MIIYETGRFIIFFMLMLRTRFTTSLAPALSLRHITFAYFPPLLFLPVSPTPATIVSAIRLPPSLPSPLPPPTPIVLLESGQLI